MSDWISIETRLPPEELIVLVGSTNPKVLTTLGMYEEGKWALMLEGYIQSPTADMSPWSHWQPLPSPPEAGQ